MLQGKAWQASEFGSPQQVLKLESRDWGEPMEGWLLVEVSATGVALPDLMMTQGIYPLVPVPPVTPGQEVCGKVVAVRDSSRFHVGERILGTTAFYCGSGGLAEYAYVSEAQCSHVPSTLSDEEAAGFYIGFRTAHAGLVERAKLQSGEFLLVLGGSGSSGATAIQLGKALGAVVIAVASGPEKLAFCRTVGADHVIDRISDDLDARLEEITGGQGVNVIFDPVGGELATNAVKSIARFGRIVIIGFAAGSWIVLDPLDMVLRNYSAVGTFAGGFTPEEDARAVQILCEMAERGQLKTPIGKVFAFDEVPSLIQQIADGAPSGKLAVRVR